MDWKKYQVDVPEGASGGFAVKRFTVSEDESRLDAMRNAFHGSSRYTRPGTYTWLRQTTRWRDAIMSDTRDEILDHYEPIRRATGRCLVNGLGLGVVANGMLMNPDVKQVTCIEISQDVINLVAPHWMARWGDRFEVICADAITWKPPKGFVFDVVWHDIWIGICSDNLKDMAVLHRQYGKRCGWQGSWAKALCKRQH